MTIAEKTTSARNDYIGNGVNTNFSFTFEVLNEANSLTGKNYSLKVLLTTSGVEAEQVEDTDYTVTYDSSTRLGSITFTTAPASGVLITLLSNISFTQSTDYINIGTDKFPADSHEGTVDKLTLIARELQEQIDRSILLPESSTLSNVTIPVSSANASKFITVNAAGDDLTVSEIADTVGSPVSTFMKTVLDDETAAAARTTLGAQANIITTRGDIIRGSSTGVAERLALGSANQILKSNGTDISWSDFDKASTLLRGLSILPKRITISNGTDADHDIDSTNGNFIFADGSGQAVLNGITKKIDADFALGTAAGGMPATVNKTGTYATTGTAVTGTGTAFNTEFSVGDVLWSATKGEGRRITAIGGATSMTLASAFSTNVAGGETVQKNGLAPDTTYHYIALSTSDGSTTDAGFDTQLDGSNLLADSVVSGASLTKYKRIAALVTDGSANIRNGAWTFNPDGSYEFIYSNPIEDRAAVSPPSTPTLQPLSTPGDVVAIMTAFRQTGPGSATAIIISNVSVDASFSSFNVRNQSSSSSGSEVVAVCVSLRVKTTTNSQVYIDSTSTSGQLQLITHGWFDNNL